MRIWPYKYKDRVCPSCKSKRLNQVVLKETPYNKDYIVVKCEEGEDQGCLDQTGYLCANCGRYHKFNKSKFTYDRAEMKRDADRLNRFLEEGKG